MEAAFGDKKCQFFDETRRFLKCIPGGTDEKSNAISAKKGHFLAQSVASKQALRKWWYNFLSKSREDEKNIYAINHLYAGNAM